MVILRYCIQVGVFSQSFAILILIGQFDSYHSWLIHFKSFLMFRKESMSVPSQGYRYKLTVFVFVASVEDVNRCHLMCGKTFFGYYSLNRLLFYRQLSSAFAYHDAYMLTSTYVCVYLCVCERTYIQICVWAHIYTYSIYFSLMVFFSVIFFFSPVQGDAAICVEVDAFILCS